MNYSKNIISKPREQIVDDSSIIELTNIKKSFGDIHVLKGFNLKVQKGENVAVLGKSGSGKSVLIKCIVGLIRPDSGKVNVFGEDILKLNKEDLNKVRSKMGFLFQSNALYDSLTVRENLEFSLRRLRVPKTPEEIDLMVKEALSSVGLSDTENLMPSTLSGGMQKRVGIARTLILRPDIILYDEPSTGLDPITSREISDLMVSINKEHNTSSIIISHDLACIKRVAHRVVLLMDGFNYMEGSYEELSNSKDELIKEFFD